MHENIREYLDHLLTSGQASDTTSTCPPTGPGSLFIGSKEE
jgi:hypothetical protein